MSAAIRKLVLAYSGGLDTSVILHWIRAHFGCEVVAYCADVGQGDETEGLEHKALTTGASKLYLEDLREEFAREFVFPMMRANAVYESYYLLGTSIARPAIARKQVEIALREGADAVAHVATGKGNDQVEMEYLQGEPVAVNGDGLPPARIIERANQVGGRHGIGRVDLVENRYVGIKSRGVYETPGATILLHAHRAVEQLTLDREVMHLRDSLIPRYAEMVYYGYWFAPERDALQALVDDTQKNVNGVARLKLFKGRVWIAGRKSPDSLYDPKIASFEEAGGYEQTDARGIIKLGGIRLRALARASSKGRS